MSESAFLDLLRTLGIACTTPGFRSSLRDFGADAGYAREVCEAALAHVASATEQAYARSDLLERRRALMDAWARHVTARMASS